MLAELYKTKLAVLEDQLARQQFKEELRQQNEQHKGIRAQIDEW